MNNMKIFVSEFLRLKNSNVKYIIYYLLSLFFISVVLNYATGHHGAKGIDIVFSALLLVTISFIPVVRVIVIIPVFLIFFIYYPIGDLYGYPTISIIASALQTNKLETKEFLSSIPVECGALSVLVILSFILMVKVIWKSNPNLKIKIATFAVLLITSAVLFADGNLAKIKILSFFIDGYKSYINYEKQIDSINASYTEPEWQIDTTTNNKKYKNIVIIVGESMRADYMSLFGYPLATTPFLDKINGTFYSNYISTAPNTFLSLSRTLTLSHGNDFNLSYNINSLAKKSGMDTYWLSNQGFVGVFDVPVSKMAIYSEHVNFLKKGEFGSLNIDDQELLPYLDDILSKKTDKNKLIVMHIMGSHSNFCDRLNGEEPFFSFKKEDLSCYISSYRKTDKLIEKIYQSLTEQKESFEIIYFSDHGLSERKIGDELLLKHGVDKKQNYHVPLILLSSNDHERKFINELYSAFDFMSLFAQEAGIKIKKPIIHAWKSSGDDTKVYNGDVMTLYKYLANEPASLPY